MLYDYHTIIPIARQVKSGECNDFCRPLMSMNKPLPGKALALIRTNLCLKNDFTRSVILHFLLIPPLFRADRARNSGVLYL